VRLLNRIQVSELLAIDGEVRPARDAGDAVHRKTGPFVRVDPEVEEQEREAERVDDRRGEQVEQARVPEEGGNALLQPPVRVPRLRVEPDAAPVDAVPPSLLLLADIPGERLFGFAEVDDDAIDIRGHAASLRS
jgi:hypothetical protein